jgi:hypothetical protein
VANAEYLIYNYPVSEGESVMEITASLLNQNPTDGFLTIVADGVQHTVLASNPMFASAVSAFQSKDWDALMLAIDPSLKFKNLYAKYEQIEVKDGSVFVSGDVVRSIVADRIINYLADGIDCLPIFKFITRLQLNPSKRAVDELYTFLEHKYLPLTESGTFLAYKAVRADFTDKHTGKFDNSVGNVLEMPRNKVDDNKEVGCSYGFHAGTLEYASGFASGNDKLVLVEIDPADVVSIPTDCNFQKLRTCRYKVVSEYERPLSEQVYQSRFSTENDDDVDDEWDSDSCVECDCCDIECDECLCCNDCCYCKNDSNEEDDEEDEEEEELEDAYEPQEVQLTLSLDNRMQSVDWTKVKVNVNALLNHLFKSRRPAVAMAIRRDNSGFDIDEIPFGSLMNYTTKDDALNIYNELNP